MAKKIWLGTDGTTPLSYAVAANWSASGVPTASDEVFIQNTGNTISAGLNQSAVALTSFTVNDAFTGRIGTTTIAAGAYLQIASALVSLHTPSGISSTGSDLIKLDLGSSTAATVYVYGSSQSSAETGLEPIRLIGTNAGNKLHQYGGRVGVATSAPGEVATFAEVNLSDGTLTLGAGVTLTDLFQLGGTVNVNCAATTITQDAGTLTTRGTGAITTIKVGGNANLLSTGTITSLHVRDGGFADLRTNLTPRTVTNIYLYKGSKIAGGSHITNTLFRLVECTIDDVEIEWGTHLELDIADA